MKILLISNMYPNNQNPQFGIFVKNTVDILENDNIEVEKLVLFKTKGKLKKIINYGYFYARIIGRLLFKKYDCVYIHYASHDALPVLFMKKIKSGIKVVTNVHGSDVVPETKFQARLQKYVKRLLEISTIVITPSRYFKEFVAHKYHLNEGKIKVFPSGGINKTLFQHKENKLSFLLNNHLSPDNDYIGYVGRIDYQKGWDIFLEAIRLLKEDHFLTNKEVIIIGNGKQYSQFQSYVERHHLSDDLVCIPMLPQKKLVEFYNCMDVFCFPTMRKGESLGLVGLEAMACGVPVIGSHIGGLKDYIKDGVNGYFFEPGNSRDLSDKIKLFFDNTNIESMKGEAIKTSEKYDREKVKKQLIPIFHQLGSQTRVKHQKVCLISSSGGHLSQLKKLIPVANNFDLSLITEKNATTTDLKEKYKTFYLLQQDRKNKYLPLLLMINSLLSIYYFLRIRPKVIISTGAGAVIPFCMIGKLFGAKIVFIESFAKVSTPTVTGRLIYKFANEFYIQWPELKKYYPKSNYRGTIY